MSGNIQRLWPTFQVLGRTLVCNRSEVVQQSVKAYNHQFNQNHQQPILFGSYGQSSFHDETGAVSLTWSKTQKGTFMKVVSRHFVNETWHYVREFSDEENEQAYKILQPPIIAQFEDGPLDKNLKYDLTPSDFLNQKDWEVSSTEDILSAFYLLSKLAIHHKMNMMENNFGQTLLSKVGELDTNSVLKIIASLLPCSQAQCLESTNLVHLWNSLDDYCIMRSKKLDCNTLFTFLHYWYMLKSFKKPSCFVTLLNVLARDIKNLDSKQLVQFMFFASYNRDMGQVKTADLEKVLLARVEEFSIQELGVIALGFFKTRNKVRKGSLIDEMVRKLTQNLETVPSHSLASLLKILRYSLEASKINHCQSLLDQLYPHVNRFNHFALIQIALFGNGFLIYHRNIINEICEIFARDIFQLRLKDLERFTYVLMLYRVIPSKYPHIYNLIIEELRRPERIIEINHFPSSFISCVSYLVSAGQFPYDLISATLQPSMINLLQSSSFFESHGRELNELDWSIKIECRQYPGYRLDPLLSQHLTKENLGRIPSRANADVTRQEKLLLDVNEKFCMMCGEDTSVITFVLPHFSVPDIVFCTTSDGNPLKVPEEYLQLPQENLKLPIGRERGLLWNVLLVGGRNSFIRDTTSLRGNFEMKRRQLEILGYRVSILPHFIYSGYSVKSRLFNLEKVLNHSTLRSKGLADVGLERYNLIKSLHSATKSPVTEAQTSAS